MGFKTETFRPEPLYLKAKIIFQEYVI